MSRFPNPSQFYGDPLAFSGRNNGFRNRRLLTEAGAYTWTVPDDLPLGPDGYGRIKAFAIGPGGDNAGTTSGGGGGFSLAHAIRCKPGDEISGAVGAVGASHSTLTLNGVTLTANRGAGATPGSASGGDVNTTGGPGMSTRAGGTSGSPWGDGVASEIVAASWLNPGFSMPNFVSGTYTGGGEDPIVGSPNAILSALALHAGLREGWWDIEDILMNGQVVFETSGTVNLVIQSIVGGGGSKYGKAGFGGGSAPSSGGVEANPIGGGPGLVGWWW